MTGRKKGVSIGAAMKQRMDSPEAGADEQPKPVQVAPAQRGAAEPTEAEDPLESFNTRLPRSLHRALKMHAAAEGIKIQDIVQHALNAYLGKK